jgi:hypothetical protein
LKTVVPGNLQSATVVHRTATVLRRLSTLAEGVDNPVVLFATTILEAFVIGARELKALTKHLDAPISLSKNLFSVSATRFDLAAVCWVDQAFCPKAGVAGYTT